MPSTAHGPGTAIMDGTATMDGTAGMAGVCLATEPASEEDRQGPPPGGRRGGAALGAYRAPASVAVVGASDDPAKWGYWVGRGALAGSDHRRVFLVNDHAATVQGHVTAVGLSELPEAPELVVVCVPGPYVHDVVRDGLVRGVAAFLVVTSAVPDEEGLRQMVRAAGARIVGPNSLGLFDAAAALRLAWGHFLPGPLAVVSQSGQLGSEIAGLGARIGLGISRFISVGNQLDVTAGELLADLADHVETTTVALYLEGFSGGDALVRTMRELGAAGKDTLVLTTGASDGSRRLARSHTGSLTSELDTVDAACRAAGAVRVATPTEVVHTARYLQAAVKPAGRRIAVISDSGGQGGIAADVAAARGLDTTAFSSGLRERMAAILPAGAATSNPVDLAGAGEVNLQVYADLLDVLLHSGEVDAVVLSGYLGCYGEDTPTIASRELDIVDSIGDIVGDAGVPLVVHSMSAGSASVARLWDRGVPVYQGIEFAMQALAAAAALAGPGRELASDRQLTNDRPHASDRQPTNDRRPASDQPYAAADLPAPGYWGARGLLESLGISVPAGFVASNRSELAWYAAGLTFPVVLKAGWLEHKSEHGGVKLGLQTPHQLLAAFDAMRERLGDGGYVVEEQDHRADVVEVLVGARQDRDFGAVVTVGAGGTEAELTKDVCAELAPVDKDTARAMIGRLRCLPLLRGWRGRPATDIEALADVVVAVSEAVVAEPRITELEVNPIRVAPDGAMAVDALVLTTATGSEYTRAV